MSLELTKLQRVIQEVRKYQSDMNAQTMLAFIYIADRDDGNHPTTVQDVGAFLGVSSASASRNVSILSKVSYTGKDGSGLIYAEENPARRIEKFIRLTPEGKQLSKRLKEYMHEREFTWE